MSQRARMWWLALCLALTTAFAVPLSAAAQDEDEESAAEEEADDKPAATPESKDEDAESEDAAEDEAEAADDEDEADWSATHSGLYLIAEGAYGFVMSPSDLESKAKDASNLTNVNSHVDDSWGYGGRLGYRLTERVALEGQFQYLQGIEIQQHVAGASNAKSDATLLTATGNAKGYLLTGRIQPYVLGGIGYGRAELDPAGTGTKERDDGFVARFGLGTDLYLNDSVGVMTELAYVLPTGGVSDYDNLVIGFGLVLRVPLGD